MRTALPRAFLAAFLLASLCLSALVALKPGRGLLDFGAFYMSGIAQDRGLDPFGVYPELAAQTGENFGYTDGRGHSPNLNPPISVYPSRLLVHVDAGDVMFGLNVLSGVMFAACGLALLRANPEHRSLAGVLWLGAFGGFWYTLWLGQIYVLLFALGLAAWLLIQRGTHPVAAGILLGLLVGAKPNFLLWPLFLLLAGHPRIALPALATAAAVSAVPLVLEGPGIYQQWLEAAQAYPRLALAGNASLIGEAERIGVPIAGYVASAALVAASAAVMFRTRATALHASAWGIVVAFLASPIAWIGYGLMLIPVLMSRRWQAGEWAVAIGLSGAWFVIGIGEPYVAASLLLMYLLVNDQLVRRELSNTVEAARTLAAHRDQVAA